MDVQTIQNYYKLQYKLLHRILPTNKWLKKYALSLMQHRNRKFRTVFLDCTFVTGFWSEVLKWLKKYQSWRQVLLSNEEIILGFKGGKYTL